MCNWGEIGQLILLLNVIIGASVSLADICSHLPGYTLHRTSCFKLYNTAKTWAAAEASCVADGGHLTSIHSSEEQAFLAVLAASAAGSWIGLAGTSPTMAWSDGTDVDYANWAASEPDRTGAGCCRLRQPLGYSWQAIQCNLSAKYICRAEPDAGEIQVSFQKVPGGMDTDPAVSPSSTHTVSSMMQCARRCQQYSDCMHFIMREDSGKYLCETYITLYRAITNDPSPIDNYKKIYS